MQVTYNPHTA